jgi:hypothetical protein
MRISNDINENGDRKMWCDVFRHTPGVRISKLPGCPPGKRASLPYIGALVTIKVIYRRAESIRPRTSPRNPPTFIPSLRRLLTAGVVARCCQSFDRIIFLPRGMKSGSYELLYKHVLYSTVPYETPDDLASSFEDVADIRKPARR